MILPRWALPVAIAAALITSHALTYRHGASVEQARNEAARSAQQEEAQRRAREEERRRQSAIEVVRKNAQDQIAQAAADAAAADAAADGLRFELDRIKRRAANCSGSAVGSAPGTDSTALLADMLAELEQAGRAMAAEADRRRIAGLACEAAYDAITPNSQSGR